MTGRSGTSPASVLILNWRDTSHPEGGGSELYVERVADGLARRGVQVTVFTARYPGSRAEETRPSGVRVVRRGGRFSVYLRAVLAYRTGRLGTPEAVVEVQNGVPFLATLWARVPVVVLVHHVHREQWHVVMGPRLARIGWWVESRLAPRVNRGARYIAVSTVTRSELIELGVRGGDVEIVHNGTTPAPAVPVIRSVLPSLLVLGRLVPHKRIELAIDTLVALRPEFPDLTLTIAGRGWWEPHLRAYCRDHGVHDHVRFTGFVSEAERHDLYGQSWVSLVPSLKEGWGLVVVEAGSHATPSVAFHGAGGLSESIVDGQTGLLARHDDVADFVAATRSLLADAELRTRLGRAAAAYAQGYSWDATVDGVAGAVERAVTGAELSAQRR